MADQQQKSTTNPSSLQLDPTVVALISATIEQQRPLLLEAAAETAANVVGRLMQRNQNNLIESVSSEVSKKFKVGFSTTQKVRKPATI